MSVAGGIVVLVLLAVAVWLDRHTVESYGPPLIYPPKRFEWLRFSHADCCSHPVVRLFIMEKGIGLRRFPCTQCSCVMRVTT